MIVSEPGVAEHDDGQAGGAGVDRVVAGVAVDDEQRGRDDGRVDRDVVGALIRRTPW